MCFGAAASVWNLNRAADAVQMVLRALLLVLFGHYVDDFNGTEDEPLGLRPLRPGRLPGVAWFTDQALESPGPHQESHGAEWRPSWRGGSPSSPSPSSAVPEGRP